jgi:hypothetical protein
MKSNRAVLLAIVLGGLIAGTLDIAAAMLINHAPAEPILRFIASGLLGKAALTGGLRTAAIGMLLQWLISLIIAAVFVLASLRLPILRRLWIPAGLAYGVVVFVVMEYVVQPLSAIHRVPHFTPESLAKNLAAMLVFGLIVAATAHFQLGSAKR